MKKAGGESEELGNGSSAASQGGAGGKAAWARGPLPWWAELPEVEPWPEPVDGAKLLDAIREEALRFVVFPKWGPEVTSLFTLHSYAFWLREVTTYLGIESPEKECGKSTLLTVLSRLVDRPAVSANISSSAFFRVIEELQPTLLIDEADTNLRGNDDLAGILNAGYTKPTGFVWRMRYGPGPKEAEGLQPEAGTATGWPARYSCWCPKAIGAIGNLPPTLASRCIVIRMHRKLEGEECERLKNLKVEELKRKCARFVADHAEEIGKAEPKVPEGLTNRAADIWESLLVLADLAGGRWPELARQAAVGLTARAQEHSPIGSLLLDIFLIFIERKTERLFSRELLEMLANFGERPWFELKRGKALTEAWLAQQLRPYGIRPRTMRIGEQVGRGYAQEDMVETFRRYIPKSEVERLKAELDERRVPEGGAQGEPESGTADGGNGI